jgi:hypothetical protein
MIWLILGFLIVFGYMCNQNDPEVDAMRYVGKDEFDKQKNLLTEKEFKEYVKKNSKLMQKAMDDAEEHHRKSRK